MLCHLVMWLGWGAGESGVDQLVEIIKVLGTPSREEIHAMNPNYTEFKFPQIKAHAWSKVFSKRLPADAIDLVRPVPRAMGSTRSRSCNLISDEGRVRTAV